MATTATKPSPAMSAEEEDALVHARIMNDERPLKRLTKKFHAYSSLVYPSAFENLSGNTSVDDAREAFLIELAGFQLQLRKAQLVCDAEHRQCERYKKESSRIAEEHIQLRREIEELKAALEQAQLERRRKIEYDQITEKINNLPSREELELEISALEGDMQVIVDEHETQDRNIMMRKSALDIVVSELGKVLISGVLSNEETGLEDPTQSMQDALSMELDDMDSEAENGRGSLRASSSLNPSAQSFTPHPSSSLLQTATKQLRMQSAASLSRLAVSPSMSREGTPSFTPVVDPDSAVESSVVGTPPRQDAEYEQAEEGEEVEDVEMGEVSELKDGKDLESQEDREEGEASDASSDLTDPPE